MNDSIPAAAAQKPDWEMLRNIPLDDLINQLATRIVHFAIQVAIAVAIFYIGRFFIRKILGIVKAVFVRRKVDPSLATFLLSVVSMLLYFILFVTVIGILGIETSSFLALFASAGVAIGMALSGTLQNFAGGVLILLLKPYKVGDYIEAQGYAGTVREIQIFHTLITTPDNKAIIIPNGGLSTGSVNNWSRQPYRRVDWAVSVAYGNALDTVEPALLEIVNTDPDVVTAEQQADRAPAIVLSSLGASSVDLTLRAWVPTTLYWEVYNRVYKRIYTELPRPGIEFPFPQLDVHVQNADA